MIKDMSDDVFADAHCHLDLSSLLCQMLICLKRRNFKVPLLHNNELPIEQLVSLRGPV